jgi:mannan endo-1,4-beta-mannosidase
MRTRPILYRALIQLLLISILWLVMPITPVALAVAPDYSGLEPANPYASEDARKVLNYLAGLPSQENNRVVSGQNLSHEIRNAASGYSRRVVALYNATGKWVGLLGADYGTGATPAEITDGNQVLIEYWNGGGLITISNTANNPWTGGTAWDTSRRDLVELITPGTQANQTWMAELDKIAAGLAELRDAGVVVLWRPFHEMTFTRVFWWDSGAHPGNPWPFINLWRHMFNYFTYEKGLDNLLWVYSAGNNDSYNPVLEDMYPGDEYVDIVGIDIYNDTVYIGGDAYEKLLALGKPVALTEFGPGARDGSFDNVRLVNTIRQRYPQLTYFLTWHSWTDNETAIVDNQNAAALLNDPWVITRDDVHWRSAPSSEGIVIDDTSAGFSTDYAQDSWQEYVDTGQNYGNTHVFNRETGSGRDVATWSFTVPEPGTYEVYAWWWASDWRPLDVPYTVRHADGSTTVRVDQRTDGAQWNLLGTFRFIDEGSVFVSDDVSSGRDIVADAIRVLSCVNSLPLLPPVGPGEVIIDNTDPRFSANYAQDGWHEYIDLGGQNYGGSHLFNREAGSGQDMARWTFTVPEPGVYEVYVWWWASEWRPPDVPYTVNHVDGSTTVRVDQRTDGAQWNLLGTFHFIDEGSVIISDDVSSGRDIVADAIRLVQRW